jgi:hypothetical protein
MSHFFLWNPIIVEGLKITEHELKPEHTAHTERRASSAKSRSNESKIAVVGLLLVQKQIFICSSLFSNQEFEFLEDFEGGCQQFGHSMGGLQNLLEQYYDVG